MDPNKNEGADHKIRKVKIRIQSKSWVGLSINSSKLDNSRHILDRRTSRKSYVETKCRFIVPGATREQVKLRAFAFYDLPDGGGSAVCMSLGFIFLSEQSAYISTAETYCNTLRTRKSQNRAGKIDTNKRSLLNCVVS